jgi:hypothetical protein
MHIEPPVQALPQTPQLSFDVARSTHAFPHLFSPCEQKGMQFPALQTSSTEQACKHAPQLAGSDSRTAHRVPQAEAPCLQEQVPSMQDWIGEQAWSQAPQCSCADCRSTHPAVPQKLRPPVQLGILQRP